MAITTHHWSTFNQLGETSKTNWLGGLLLLHDAEIRTLLRENAWWSAARSFGTATEIELRERVFDRFAVDYQEASASWPISEGSRARGDLLAKFTRKRSAPTDRSKPGLGLMIDWLELVQKQGPQRGHKSVQALHEWVLRNNRKLKKQRDFERLRSHLVEARNEAVHERVSEEDALALCREAEQLLKDLI